LIENCPGYTLASLKRLTIRQLKSLYEYVLDRQSDKRVEVATLIRLAVNADKPAFDKAMRSFRKKPGKSKAKDNLQTAESGDIMKLGLGYQNSEGQ